MLKNRKKKSDFQRAKEKAFKEKINNLFDMAHQDAMEITEIQLDKDFLVTQKRKGSTRLYDWR